MTSAATLASPNEVLATGLGHVLGLDARQARVAVRRLSGGASQETWAVDVWPAGGDASGGAGGGAAGGVAGGESGASLGRGAVPLQRHVLRRSPAGVSARNAGNIGLVAEAQLISLVAQAGVPVPAVVATLQPEHGLGVGFIGQWLDGETLGARVAAAPRPALARACGQALAAIHAMPLAGLPPLRHTQPAAEVQHLRSWHARHGTVRPVFQLALRHLADTALPDVAPALVHGDFRNGNLMVDITSDGGAGRLVGVLDWELAHLGDPMADLAWLGMNAWRFGHADLAVGGFGHWRELFAGYQSAGGRLDVDRVRWWHLLGTLRWGVICESMGQAWATGAEPVMDKAAIARRASETEIDMLDLLAPQAAWPPPAGHVPVAADAA